MTGLEVAVEHLVEVVGLVADAVVGDPVLREVVGADPLGAVDGADLAAAGRAGLGVGCLLRARASSRARRIRIACSLFCSWLFSFWQLTTMPVGRWVMRTAESVVLTLWPPGPAGAEDVDAQVVVVDLDVDLLGLRAAPARRRREVCTRPCDSVTGTRCTRCTPPSNFSSAYGASPGSGVALAPSPRR